MPRDDKSPMQLIDEFLHSDTSLEGSIWSIDRSLAIFLKGAIIVGMIAYCVIGFGLFTYVVLWIYGTGFTLVLNHWKWAIVGLCVFFVLGAVGKLVRDREQNPK